MREWGTESERQRGGGSEQFHLPGGASDEGRRRNTGHQKRTALAYASFNRLNKMWRARGISRKTKATLFKTLVLPVLLYGCETWKLTKLDTYPDQVPQKNIPHEMAAVCEKQGSAGDGRSRPNKRGGEKEEMVLDWTCPEERSEQRLCCCPRTLDGKRNRGRPKTR